ncbi:hypothetical protein CY652_15395 [Burkholderia sp. WAC0059]|uniref:tetratricopeptide repeat-containing sulfotransferase family protein n=1 Tax=Burkholderia sp. WAC0059 TaxID=2066022 RepID=UPI000C7EC9C2|nr:sulfotransferase [Burkholderia sp. WAC0059]PLZ01498.1 hypothetical protein CY652_15395 [Burkholderia sp. WAC0059]
MTINPLPGTAQDWFLRGTAHAGRGELEQALECFGKARVLRPMDAIAHQSYGLTLIKMKRFEDALTCFRGAAIILPENADIQHQLGWLLEQLLDLEDATRCFRRAVQLNPRADGSYNNLANCLQALGRFDEAREVYRKAIDIAPDCALYYRNLVQVERLAPDDPYFVALEARVARAGTLKPQDQSELHFAFGKALSDLGQDERAFGHFMIANAQGRLGVEYDEAATLNVFAQLPSRFTTGLLAAKRGLGDPSDSPVFIVGMPRSGSTLVEQILASHPQVFGAGERADFGLALGARVVRDGEDPAGRISLDTLADLSREQLAGLGADYLRRIGFAAGAGGTGGSHRRIVDKYPFNFVNLGFIHLALPNARIIHTRRSAVETCLSIFSRPFRDVPFGYDLGELGRYCRAYDALMDHWRRVLPEGVMLEVQYEDLVDDLEGNVRRLLAHCGLEWDERCLAFHEAKRQVSTASSVQVRTPLYRTSLKRWRPQQALLQPLLDGLGPALSAGFGQTQGADAA